MPLEFKGWKDQRINGVFEPTQEFSCGCAVYRKRGAAEVRLSMGSIGWVLEVNGDAVLRQEEQMRATVQSKRMNESKRQSMSKKALQAAETKGELRQQVNLQSPLDVELDSWQIRLPKGTWRSPFDGSTVRQAATSAPLFNIHFPALTTRTNSIEVVKDENEHAPIRLPGVRGARPLLIAASKLHIEWQNTPDLPAVRDPLDWAPHCRTLEEQRLLLLGEMNAEMKASLGDNIWATRGATHRKTMMLASQPYAWGLGELRSVVTRRTWSMLHVALSSHSFFAIYCCSMRVHVDPFAGIRIEAIKAVHVEAKSTSTTSRPTSGISDETKSPVFNESKLGSALPASPEGKTVGQDVSAAAGENKTGRLQDMSTEAKTALAIDRPFRPAGLLIAQGILERRRTGHGKQWQLRPVR